EVAMKSHIHAARDYLLSRLRKERERAEAEPQSDELLLAATIDASPCPAGGARAPNRTSPGGPVTNGHDGGQ
ncbi:MAG TPA: hypothetical protein VKF37_08020, partial [Chloroflexota bacterium]|nr:hypothetical protein [Chloroflexota bacterium]